MLFEAHCMSFPLYRTLIIQLCQGKYSFPFYGTFKEPLTEFATICDHFLRVQVKI